MSKEKKAVELKDEELEKVSGGIILLENVPENAPDCYIPTAYNGINSSKWDRKCDVCDFRATCSHP